MTLVTVLHYFRAKFTSGTWWMVGSPTFAATSTALHMSMIHHTAVSRMIQAEAPTVERDIEAGVVEVTVTDANDIQADLLEVDAASSEQNGATADNSSVQTCSVAFACLYTKHKTQKRKIWHDGRLILGSCQAVLYNANPAPGSEGSPLGECELSNSQRNAILQKYETRLEFEQFLVEIQGLWNDGEPKKMISTLVPARSRGMQRVLTKRFQKPGAFVPPDPTRPPPPHQQSHPDSALGKRRRPLQPGELQQRFYGKRAAVTAPAVAVASAWHQQVTPPPAHFHSTPHVPSSSSSSQRRTPFVTSNQMQDTEHWSPRRQNDINSNDSLNRLPNQRSNADRTMMAPREERDFASPAALPDRHTQNPRNPLDSIHPDRARNEFNPRLPESNIARQPNQFRDKNGFDPNSFLGEEEEPEDESEDEEQEEIRLNRNKPWLPAAQEQTPKEKQRTAWDRACPPATSNTCISKSQPDRSREEQTSSVLSRNELLQLFATGSPAEESSPIQERLSVQRDPPVEKPSEATSFELVLPSASESSSDDDSA